MANVKKKKKSNTPSKGLYRCFDVVDWCDPMFWLRVHIHRPDGGTCTVGQPWTVHSLLTLGRNPFILLLGTQSLYFLSMLYIYKQHSVLTHPVVLFYCSIYTHLKYLGAVWSHSRIHTSCFREKAYSIVLTFSIYTLISCT